MTDLDFENDEPLKKCSWQTRKGNDDDDDDDGMPQKGLPAQIHTKDDFQKGWERSSERILNSFRLGSCLKEASFAHLPAEAVRLAETSWVSVTFRAPVHGLQACRPANSMGKRDGWKIREGFELSLQDFVFEAASRFGCPYFRSEPDVGLG